MEKDQKLLSVTIILSVITIIYNVIEGFVSVYFGANDNALSLSGFGVDSFVEVISGIGILHMVLRMKKHNIENRDVFESRALKITGISFFILMAGLLFGSVMNIINSTKPNTTIAGIIISLVSIITMYFLLREKLKMGRALNSEAIIADANCTKTCFYLSFILLGSSLLFELTGIAYADIIGSLGIAYFAFREGREAWEKSKNSHLSCCCDDDCK